MGLSALFAQLVEHLICKHGVVGSSSASGTLFPPNFSLLLNNEHVKGYTGKTKFKIPAKNSTDLQIEKVNCNVHIMK